MADIMLGQLLHRPTIDPISGDSPLPVQLSGSLAPQRKRIVHVSTQLSTQIDSGTFESTYLRCAEGAIATVKLIYVFVPAVTGATSGTHMISIATPTPVGTCNTILEISSAYDKTVNASLWSISTPTGASIQSAEQWFAYISDNNLIFGPTSGDQLAISYRNNTDAPQTGNREVFYKAVEEAVTW